MYILMFGFGFVMFSLAIDGNQLQLWESQFVFDRVLNSPRHLYFWCIYLLGFLIFFLLLSNKRAKFDSYRIDYGFILKWARILGSVSVIIALYNLIYAAHSENYFESPRQWEYAFGRSALLNYLYFLHLPALVFYGFALGRRKARGSDVVLIIALLVSSTFHGIKFTILHAFIFFTLGYYSGANERIKVRMVAAILCCFIIVGAYFEQVRGGGISGIFGYVISPSINSMYYINHQKLEELGSLAALNPAGFLPSLDRIRQRVVEHNVSIPSAVGVDRGFVLNPSYNLKHAIHLLSYCYGLGFLLYSLFFSLAINMSRVTSKAPELRLFFLAFVSHSVLFLFSALEFQKTKLWWGFLVVLLLLLGRAFLRGLIHSSNGGRHV